MKMLPALLLPVSLACVAPKASSDVNQANKEKEFHFWQATLKSTPLNFPFPSDLPGLEMTGSVEIEMKIDTQGNPSHVTARNPRAVFARTAERFVMACTFQPARLDDSNLESKLKVRVVFNVPTKSIKVLTADGKPFRPAEFM